MNASVSSFTVRGPAGGLEAVLDVPAPDLFAQPLGTVVIAHPHPQFGGTMHNKVIYTCQRVAAERGLATLRFNFRGVGTSAGQYDDGQGEQADVKAGLDRLAAELPGRPLTLMGFSFGAWLTLKVGAPDPRVGALIALGVPVGWAELGFLAGCGKPKLFVHGTRDQFCDPEELRRRYPDFCAPKHLEWIEGADHFFTNQLDELAAVLRERFPAA